MHTNRFVAAFFLLLMLGLRAVAVAQASAQNSPVSISYTVGMTRPHTHLFEVDVEIKRNANGPAEENLVMPVWTPGSYMIREFARNVQDFAAKDAAGQALKWEKTNKDSWRV